MTRRYLHREGEPGISGSVATRRPEKHPPLGSPFSEALNGEVYGPNGRRCYTPAVAGRLAGKTRRWANGIDAFQEGSGHRRRFIDAKTFEEPGVAEGRWPPAGLPPVDDRQTIAREQERDLETLRASNESLTTEVDRLRCELERATADKARALQMVADLANMAKPPPPVQSTA